MKIYLVCKRLPVLGGEFIQEQGSRSETLCRYN
jgi:hypothetical protein